MKRISAFRLAVGLAAASLAISVGACGKPKDPIQRLLAAVENAAEKRDAEAVVVHLTPDFAGEAGLNRTDAGAELRRYFALYEGIDVALTEVTVEQTATSATVRMRVSLAGRPRQVAGLDGLLPGTAAYFFELNLTPQDRDWLIRRASWRPAADNQ